MSRADILRGKRVLVTGGSGFIGSHIVDLLLSGGVGEVVVIDNMVRGRPQNLSHAMASGRVRLVEGDVRDAALLASLVDGADTVFHMAALRITHCAAEPDAAMAVMVQATYDLLKACRAHGVRKVVYASSASIYGLASHFPTEESEPPYDNRTLYGAAKMFGEGLLRAFHDMYGLDYVALRFFNVYGRRMDLTGRYTEVMVRWMERLAAGAPPIIFGDGKQTMDLVDVRDVARACVLAATADVTDRVFNVGTGVETSLEGLARAMAVEFGRSNLVPVHEPERQVNPVPRRLASCEAAADALGFRASIDLATGLGDLIDWWMSEASFAKAEVGVAAQ
ncbi:NAD-dependent epimerase/dehydratase family protein [Acuticoccus kandeliae]|uniref:NAD-dependent epimerase/dehydratase family protein n=1 Tax=Acuticoccus kandeliae TaxID=2073160 RepID=UPI000D3E65EF|nr:NAD-dependent epimerase/dehydratase family protein [Acuticoccus kandeliae]